MNVAVASAKIFPSRRPRDPSGSPSNRRATGYLPLVSIADLSGNPVVDIRGVTKAYTGARPVLALNEVSLVIERGEFVAITGPSGCGKSTLLHLLGGLDQPDSGEIFVRGEPLRGADEKRLTRYRRETIGIVFQFFNLLPTMSALENASLPLQLAGASRAEAEEKARAVLALVGMEQRSAHFPHEMSGGELQRVAIARALSHQPALLLADEPTGNLDTANADQVIATLQKISSQTSATMLIVTHSESVAQAASRHLSMRDGKIDE